MDGHRMDGAALHRLVQGMAQQLAQDADPPVETHAGELVSVRMDGRFRLLSVTIRAVKTGSDEARRLEGAVVEAVNSAIQEVARRNAERLTALAPDLAAERRTAAP
jgi:DNA-binding protein YbaB